MRHGCNSPFEFRVNACDPSLDELTKLRSLARDFFCFCLGSYARMRVVDGISLTAARFEVIGVFVGRLSEHKSGGFEGNLV